jgi:hypothetical protein
MLNDLYRDIKCLMELDFAFEIQQISMCEEFLICSSAHECQLIQMNFDNNREKSSSRPSSSFFMRSPAVSGDQSCIPDLACGEGKRDSLISSNSSSALLSSDTLGSLNLDCSTKNEDDDEIMRLLMTCSADTEATTKKSFQKTMYADGDLLIGPVKGSTRPCPVNVEFEG